MRRSARRQAPRRACHRAGRYRRRRSTLEQVTAALTRFADACVKGALRFLLARAAKRPAWRRRRRNDLEASTGLIVLAMGKLGACELNYSSDIDLIVFYDDDALSRSRAAGEKRLAAVDLAKALVRLLSEPTADGYVFRVDLRLRPDAGATQIAISTEAAEHYYESHGPELGARRHDQGARLRRRPRGRRRVPEGARSPSSGARISISPRSRTSIRSSARSTPMTGTARSRCRATTSSSAAAASARSSSSPRPSSSSSAAAIRTCARRGTLAALGALQRARHDLARRRARSDGRLSLPAPGRAPPADDRRSADPHAARRRPTGSIMSRASWAMPTPAAFEEDLLRHLRKVQTHYAQLFEREAPLAATRRQPRLHRRRGRSRNARDARRMGFARAADMSSRHPRLASRPHPRHAQRARARAADRADAGAARGACRDRRSRCRLHAVRPLPVRPAGGRAAVLAVRRQPGAAGADRRDRGLGAAARRISGPQSRRARCAARSAISSTRCPTRAALRRAVRRRARAAARLRKRARCRPPLRQGRDASASASMSSAGRPTRQTGRARPMPRSPKP